MAEKTLPERVQRKRTKGWRMPPNTKSVTRPGKWGNPFPLTQDRTAAKAVAMFRDALINGELPYSVGDVRRELAGKNLACYCKMDGPCHADVLLEIANE